MNQKLKSKISPVIGKVEILEWDKKTSKLLDHDYDDNLFLNNGMGKMINSFSTVPDPGNEEDSVVRSIRIGDDVGTGDVISPEPAKAEDTSADQNVVITLDISQLSPSYPNYYTIRYTGILDGDEILEGSDEVDIRYSSVGMYTGDDTLVAFRRFTSRSISRGSNVEIRWTLFFEGQ